MLKLKKKNIYIYILRRKTDASQMYTDESTSQVLDTFKVAENICQMQLYLHYGMSFRSMSILVLRVT